MTDLTPAEMYIAKKAGAKLSAALKLLSDAKYAIEALHEMAWLIVLAGQDDRGNLQPPLLGDLRARRLADHAIALIGECGP